MTTLLNILLLVAVALSITGVVNRTRARLAGLAVGVVESTQARNKLSRNATFLLTIAALAALIFFVALLLHLNIDIR